MNLSNAALFGLAFIISAAIFTIILIVIDQKNRSSQIMADRTLSAAQQRVEEILTLAEQRNNELEVIKNLAEALNQTLPPEKALEVGLEMVAGQMGAISGWLLILTMDQKAELGAGYQLPHNLDQARSGGRLWALCACLKAMLNGELNTPTRFECERLSALPAGSPFPTNHLSIPVRASGIRVGILNLVLPPKRQPNDAELHLLSGLGDQFGGAIERARLFKEIHKLAITDPLTGLFNRRHLYALSIAEIERSRRYHRPVALALLDIDHFKRINDTFGHLAGDEALTELARICQETLRRVDIIGRFGGEEISILMPETYAENGSVVMERLRQRVEKLEIHTNRGVLRMTISIGMAFVSESELLNYEQLLERADQALYQAKNAGRNQVRIWENLEI